MEMTYEKPAMLHELVDRVGAAWRRHQSITVMTNVINDLGVLCLTIRHLTTREYLPHQHA